MTLVEFLVVEKHVRCAVAACCLICECMVNVLLYLLNYYTNLASQANVGNAHTIGAQVCELGHETS